MSKIQIRQLLKNRGRCAEAPVNHIVNVQVLITTSGKKINPYYTIKVGETREARSSEVAEIVENAHGRILVPLLIEAVTQDAVLVEISPVKGVVR